MPKYKCVYPMIRDRRYEIGEIVEMPEAEARQHLDSGSIVLPGQDGKIPVSWDPAIRPMTAEEAAAARSKAAAGGR